MDRGEKMKDNKLYWHQQYLRIITTNAICNIKTIAIVNTKLFDFGR